MLSRVEAFIGFFSRINVVSDPVSVSSVKLRNANVAKDEHRFVFILLFNLSKRRWNELAERAVKVG